MVNQIKRCIEQKLDEGFKNFIIFPFGDVGMKVKFILNNVYGISEEYILDNHLCKYNPQIKELAFCKEINCGQYCVILSCTNSDIYETLRNDISQYFENRCIAEFFSDYKEQKDFPTRIGKYSYGPICRNHYYIESIGAFCSFAAGVNVEGNHQMKYITTHPMLEAGCTFDKFVEYSEFEGAPWYFEGVQPKEEYMEKHRRIHIGNDVWFGQNVLVVNYANIGNGVIAGAGAVITKDVPDYAVVAGVPAKIIRYRYSPDEIEQLNRIAWWDWTDEEIRERYEDFYLPIDKFIEKYGNN